MRIGYLGPNGSHSHSAAAAWVQHVFGQNTPEGLTPMMSIAHLLDAVEDGVLDVACVPIENALEGSVNEVLDFMAFHLQRTYILAEFVRPIQHALIRKYEFMEGITHVHSHPQAIGQCREAVYELLGPDIKFVPATSTSEAVKTLLTVDEAHAALGSVQAAEHYGLDILIENIGQLHHNATRFLVLTAQSHPDVVKRAFDAFSPQYKTALCVGLKANKSGALLEILQTLADLGLNMTRIESRPTKQSLGEYLFYLDIEGKLDAAAQDALRKVTGLYQCFGQYPVLGVLQ